MAEIADLIRQPSYLWHTLCLRVVRAILDARYADAEELAATALQLGRLRQSEYPTYVFQYAQLFAIRWAQGRLREFWPSIRAHGDLFPWIPRWRDALAAAELGDRQRRARRGGALRAQRLRRCAARRALAPASVRAGRGLRPDRRQAARAAALRAAAAAWRSQRGQLHPAAVRPGGAAPRDARVDGGAVGGRGASLRVGTRALRGARRSRHRAARPLRARSHAASPAAVPATSRRRRPISKRPRR